MLSFVRQDRPIYRINLDDYYMLLVECKYLHEIYSRLFKFLRHQVSMELWEEKPKLRVLENAVIRHYCR